MNILSRKVYNDSDCVSFGFDERSSVCSSGLKIIRSISTIHCEFSECWSDRLYVNNIHAGNGLGHSEQ